MTIANRVHAWQERARGKFFAAPVTPFDSQGRPVTESCQEYYGAVVHAGADGLAVAVHTSRGSFLDIAVRAELVSLAASLRVPVVAGVGNGNIDEELRWAKIAAEYGADALLVFPQQGNIDQIIYHHEQFAQISGLPQIVFDLYTDPYDDYTFQKLIELPVVAGVKIATLFDAITCQEHINMVKTAGKVAISGEDRMLGSSLLWGAESVLVGLGAASVNLSVDLFHSFLLADFGRFKRASTLLDQFAKMTFAKPYEGYIQRMMWVAAAEGLIPSDQATDPFGPPLPKSEQLGLLTMLSHLKSTPAYLAQRHK